MYDRAGLGRAAHRTGQRSAGQRFAVQGMAMRCGFILSCAGEAWRGRAGSGTAGRTAYEPENKPQRGPRPGRVSNILAKKSKRNVELSFKEY